MKVAKVMLGGAGMLALLCMMGCEEESSTPSQTTAPIMNPPQQQQPLAMPMAMAQPMAGEMAPAAAPVGGLPGAGGPPATPDPSCPNYVGEAVGMPVDLPGCCMAEGVCGVISSLSNQCITMSLILTDLMPGPACTPAP